MHPTGGIRPAHLPVYLPTLTMTHFYEIRIEGHFDDRWQDWFDEMSVTRKEDGTTLLSGSSGRSGRFAWNIKKIRDLGMPLFSVLSIETDL